MKYQVKDEGLVCGAGPTPQEAIRHAAEVGARLGVPSMDTPAKVQKLIDGDQLQLVSL